MSKIIEEIAGTKEKNYQLDKPKGVLKKSRNFDLIRKKIGFQKQHLKTV